MKRFYKQAIFALVILILLNFSGSRMILAQTAKAQSPVRKFDRRKMNTNCTGNFLAGEPLADGSILGSVKNLSKIYDFDAFKAAALKNRFKVLDERRFVPVRLIQIDEFNRDFNSGAPYKKGDPPRIIGALRLVPEGESYVELQGRVLTIKKRVAPDEKWTLNLHYVFEGRDDFLQEIEISQEGRCNLDNDYIRARAKSLLDALGIESDWTPHASVLISAIN